MTPKSFPRTDDNSFGPDAATIPLRRTATGAHWQGHREAVEPRVSYDGESYFARNEQSQEKLRGNSSASAGYHNTGVADDEFDDDSDDEMTAALAKWKPKGSLGWRALSMSWSSKRSLYLRVTAALLIILLPIIVLAALFGSWLPKANSSPWQSPPWYPSPRGGTSERWAESYSKAQAMVQKMSLVEKVNITTGVGWQMGLCVGNTGPAISTGFPALCLQDGPLGIRFADHITAFPAGITTGATWDRDLIMKRGSAMGNEARLKGINVLLGPVMGPLGMIPAAGRNWEGFGTDPVLSGAASAATIRGIQRNGVIATAKHFVMNEQEHFRQSYEWGIPTALSSNIDDRTLHEVFVWPFAESVRAGVASVMCSYQRVNNTYACGNSKILNGILKDELGFQGFVQSDWLAQRSGLDSALAGLDMSMPGDGLIWADGDPLWGKYLTMAALNSSLPMERLNDMVTRIVAAWYQLQQDSWKKAPPLGDGGPNFSSWTNDTYGRLYEGSGEDITGVVNQFVDAQGNGTQAHGLIARQIAADGTVLVKNVDGFLPLSRNISKPGDKYRVGIYGDDAGPGQGPNACPDRGCNQGTLASGWGSGAVNFPYLVCPWEALSSAWNSSYVETTAYLTNDVDPNSLSDKDLCIAFANADSGEGYIAIDNIHGDRNDLYLQNGGDNLIETVANGCGNGTGTTIVVVHAVGPVIMESWVDHPRIKAVLLANLPGQESGNGLVDVLLGDVDASGRLPYTVGKSLEDYGPGAQVLYSPNAAVPQVNFSEGLYIDYRHFDGRNIAPRYEFGFGLSYTSFELSDLQVVGVQQKSPLPSARPQSPVAPPSYDDSTPDPRDALFPKNFPQLYKYIYPYISSVTDANKGRFYYPAKYQNAETPSLAGGGEGGNPSLYETFVRASVEVKNTGPRTGKEVVQLYVSFPDNVVDTDDQRQYEDRIDFPVRVLRNFTKVELQPGQSTNVELSLNRKDFSYWSTRKQNWVMPVNGTFKIWVGRSSRDLPLVAEY
ncbi:hypothetical protein Egran_01301 [Elaphomyces granulatus]|uniref:Probable beta-glucosidase E n=1 Tax=Elaphomyces granulatus TaxID=519963 RepID=A0A232M4B6_9EURO|nr:hypothetical protein Egran_01301 [Elaphomyces granulatus]